ncbi:MAG TPA: hypothetical protein PKY59_25550 [Pyrinomonadaceae bacterium]|nr:hypothetical protein [Pyrinomonadaceae bacterium]
MKDENLDPNPSENQTNEEPQIVVNDYGATHDNAVVVEETDRTVLLTDKETVVIEKQPQIDIVPKNRPRKVYAGMWGQMEIATVAVSMLAILAVVLFFVFFVLPAKKEVEKNRAERDRLESELTSAKAKFGDERSTEEKVAKLVSSVTDFETRFLPVSVNGRSSLYQRINGLIGAYGLVNTTGPDYIPLEIADGKNNQSSEGNSGRSKFQSIFPGEYVTMTLEGSYQNLRRFISEIERTDQFVVISAIELEPSETKGNEKQNQKDQPQQANNGVQNPPNVNPNGIPTAGLIPAGGIQNQPVQTKKAARGKIHGETVSLRLEMAAYFRRPNFVPLAPENETTAQ